MRVIELSIKFNLVIWPCQRSQILKCHLAWRPNTKRLLPCRFYPKIVQLVNTTREENKVTLFGTKKFSLWPLILTLSQHVDNEFVNVFRIVFGGQLYFTHFGHILNCLCDHRCIPHVFIMRGCCKISHNSEATLNLTFWYDLVSGHRCWNFIWHEDLIPGHNVHEFFF